MDKDTLPNNRCETDISPHKTPKTDTVSSQRRRIIRGSAAAIPVIMTLRSGAAAAVTSAYQCVARDAKETALLGNRPEDVLMQHDNWVRYVGKVGKWIKVTRGSNVINYFAILTKDGDWATRENWTFYDSDGSLLPGSSINSISDSVWSSATVFYCVMIENVWQFAQENYMQGPLPTVLIADTEIDKGINAYLLVYVSVDDGFSITAATYYPYTFDGTGANITGSCWSSARPHVAVMRPV